jgi:hypothetical protein
MYVVIACPADVWSDGLLHPAMTTDVHTYVRQLSYTYTYVYVLVLYIYIYASRQASS